VKVPVLEIDNEPVLIVKVVLGAVKIPDEIDRDEVVITLVPELNAPPDPADRLIPPEPTIIALFSVIVAVVPLPT
jgi:hypothetical protein